MNHNVKIIPIVTGISIASVHLIDRLLYSISTAKDILRDKDDCYYEWRFGTIRYTKKGYGTPVLLVHDLTVGSSGYEFHKIVNRLSRHYEVYTIDLLGYGLSDKPNMTYTAYLYIQLLTDFVKTVIGKKTDIIVSGDSSSIAIVACHNNPEAFNRLILINPQSLYQLNLIPSKRTKSLKFLIDLPVLGTFFYNIITTKQSFCNLFRKYFYADYEKLRNRDIAAYVEASHQNDHQSRYSFSSYVGRYMNFNILHALKEINHSIFVIAGNEKKDNKSIVENYFYYNSSIETAYVAETKQYPHMENPVVFLNQLAVFLP